MSKRESYKLAWSDLLNAKNEDEVINEIFKIVKSFSVDFYKNDILSNPYFKSLLPEICSSVILELLKIKKSLKEELSVIKSELKKEGDKETIKKLKSLRSDCDLLISELNDRIEEISSIM